MKILVIHSAAQNAPNERISAVDLWRITRPWNELKKHVDWEIEEQLTAVLEIDKYKHTHEFTDKEIEKSGDYLSQFDIIHSSYFTNAAQFALIMTVCSKTGAKFVLDIDDDMFAINPDNPFWLKANHKDVFNMQQMIKHAHYITTTTDRLAHELRLRREQPADTTIVVPNFISDDYPESDPNNGDKIVIGYFGGASHYRDLNQTGAIEGIERVMHKHKNVHFQSVGMVVDKYVPRARFTFTEGKRGTAWATELFPTLHFDIAIAPLEDTQFARGKSNIKWLETTRMGSAFVASNVGPYKTLRHTHNALLVANDPAAWEDALDELVTNETKRKELVNNSREQVKKLWRLEDHWTVLRDAIEKVGKHANHITQ